MHKVNLLKITWLSTHLGLLYFLKPEWQIPSAMTLAGGWWVMAIIRHLANKVVRKKTTLTEKTHENESHEAKSHEAQKNKHAPQRLPTRRDFIVEACFFLGLLSLVATQTVHKTHSHPQENLSLPPLLENPQKALLIEARIEHIFQANDKKGNYRLQILAAKSAWRKPAWRKDDAADAPAVIDPEKKFFIYLQTANPKWIEQFLPGCRFQFLIFRGRGIRPLPENSGFGDYLKKQNMQGMFYTKNNVRNLDCSQGTAYGKILQFLREKSRAAAFSEGAAGIAMGMLMGKSGFLPADLKRQGKELGILHLFAASGLHLGILFALFHLPLARFFGSKSRVAVLIPLSLCFLYLALLSFPVSLSRAFSFLALYATATLTQFRIQPLSLICNSALIVFVFFRGFEILSIGSALSFGAVSGILFLYPVFQQLTGEFVKKDKKIFRYLLAHLSVALGAHLGTALTLLTFFHTYSFFSIVANLLLVPLASLLLPFLVGAFLFAFFLQHFTQHFTEHFMLLLSALSPGALSPATLAPATLAPAALSPAALSPATLLPFHLIPLQLVAHATHAFVSITEFLYPLSLFRDYTESSLFMPPPFWVNGFLLLLLIISPQLIYQKHTNSIDKRCNRKICMLLLIVVTILIFLIGPLGAIFF